MKSKACIIFGVSVQHEERLNVLHDFLRLIKIQYNDCKVFVGINYGMHPSIESIIESYNLDVVYERVIDESMYTGSDDSAYQLALKLFYANPIKYDICWFMHTKGGFNDRYVERNLYINEFYSKRMLIEDKFSKYPYLGVYGFRAGEYWVDSSNPVDPHITNQFMKAFWDEGQIDNFNCSFCKVIIIETMFALNATLMYKFLDTYPEFFTTKLRRYFFECEITNFLSTRSGYYPGIIMPGNWATGASMDPIIDNWIRENELTYLQEYKNLISL